MKAPFPYFGGKSRIAAEVWAGLGDVGHYLEPFCGSCAVLLARPQYDPTRHVETVVDADGHIANVWRSLQAAPDEVARWCDWPANHADLIARKKRLNLSTNDLLERLCADEAYYAPKLAGYYIWAASCWIGHGLICPGQRPNLADAGKGVHAKGQVPHLADAGNGVHAKGRIPHLADAGRGVQDVYTPSIYEWFRELSERLRRVRVVCGDWSRVCGGQWQANPGRPVGVFFDPPYSDVADRDPGCYAVDSPDVAHAVRQWCCERDGDPDYRICLAGYIEEHEDLLSRGWRVHRWKSGGGYGNVSRTEGPGKGQHNRHREALFFSPHCLGPTEPGLFDNANR